MKTSSQIRHLKTLKKLNISEEEFNLALLKITKKLAHRYRFGYHTLEDIVQFIYQFCIEALPLYDPSKGGSLCTFLYIRANTRLSNLKRNQYERPKKQTKYDGAKRGLMSFLSLNTLQDNNKINYNGGERRVNYRAKYEDQSILAIFGTDITQDPQEEIIYRELLEKIDRELPAKLRKLWVKLYNGVRLNSSQMKKLKLAIQEILRGQKEK